MKFSRISSFDRIVSRHVARVAAAQGSAHLDDVGVAGRFGNNVKGMNNGCQNLADFGLAENLEMIIF